MSNAVETSKEISCAGNQVAQDGTFDDNQTLDSTYMSAILAVTAAKPKIESGFSLDSLDDSALFERLVGRHQERLYRVAYRMTGNSEEAQDLLQDAIIEAFRAFKHFRRGTYFDKWLYRIMSRTFIDRKRSQKRMKLVSMEETYSNGSDGDSQSFERDLVDPEYDPAMLLDRGTLDHRVQAGIDKLSPEYRLVIILSDIEEFSYEEIASMLECPIGTVRSRLHRARAQMREYLQRTGYVTASQV